MLGEMRQRETRVLDVSTIHSAPSSIDEPLLPLSRSVKPDSAPHPWRAGRSKTVVTRIEWRESVWSTLLVAGFTGLKTRAEVPRRNGRHVAASVRSLRSEATGEEERWPSDLGHVELD